MEESRSPAGSSHGATSVSSATPGKDRIVLLDLIRGLALLGVVIVNLHEDWTGEVSTRVDATVAWLFRYLLQGKFLFLFSLLFGLGFGLQLQRAEVAGRTLGFYVRRLVFLLALALAIIAFIHGNAILLQYALLGFPLLLFRRLSARTLLASVLAMWVGGSLLHAQVVLSRRAATTSRASQAQPSAIVQQWRWARVNAPYPDYALTRLRLFLSALASPLVWVNLLALLSNMVLGLYLLRSEWWMRLSMQRHVGITSGALVLFAIATVTRVVIGEPTRTNSVVELAGYRAAELLAQATGGVTYGLALIVLWMRNPSGVAFRALAPFGRMALTNFVLQYAMFTIVFSRFGLNAGHTLGPAYALPVGVAMCVVLVVFSHAWLRHYNFGPLEWLWRTVTYWRIPNYSSSR